LYTIVNDKIYRGNSTSYNDCMFTVNSNKIYRGNSTSYNDCIATIDGMCKLSVLVCIIGPY
jgi:hypothetical protein